MPPSAEAGAEGTAQTGTRLLLAIVVAAILVSVLNQTFTNVVVPDIRADYGATQGQAGWVITGYLLVFAVGIPLYGRIADMYSLRHVFAVGLLVLAAGSLVCALAPSLPLLVAGRVVQAAGAAAIPALGFASVAKALPAGERGTALGLLSASVGAGAAVGPVVGGVVAGVAGWQILFFLTVVLALALAPGALRTLPGSRPGDAAPMSLSAAVHHFDVPGGLSLALAAGLALFGVTEGQVSGFTSPVALGSFVLAVASVAFFALRIRRAPDPFVSPHLFENRAFLATSGVGFFMMFANVGSLVLAPLMLSEVNGLSAAGIGLVLAPGAVAVAALSPLAGRLSDRLGPLVLIRAGLLVMALSFFFISAFGAGAAALVVVVGLFGAGVGFAGVNSPNANAATGSLSRDESGVGLGIYQMLFFLGGGFGPAIAATFLALRQEGGSGAINPLYSIGADPFSDAFLLLAFSTVVALAISLATGGGRKKRDPEG